MKLAHWDPFAEMEDMMNRLPALPRMRGMQSLQNTFVPALDVYEEKDNVIVETPLAGMRPENVDISVDKGVLTIQGEHKKEHEVDEKNYYRKEVRSGSFYRQVALPVPVKEDKVDAVYENGVLKITCPKTAPTKAKKVTVKIKKPKK